MLTPTVLATEDQAIAKAFVREYVDNGLDVYDAARKRLGTVGDYDRTADGFVLRLAEAGRSLFLPMRFVCKVRRGRVYLSRLGRELTRSLQ